MLKKMIWGIITVVLVVVAINKWMPVGDQVDPLTYFDEFKDNEYNLVYEDQRIDLERPIELIDGEIYVSYEFAREYISDTIFYDSLEKVLTLTNVREVLRIYEGNQKALLNSKSTEIDFEIKEVDGKLYLPATLLNEKFSIDFQVGKENKLFIAHDQTKDYQVATVKRKTSLRTHPQKKSTVVEDLKKGETVVVYTEADGFTRVRSASGIIGYIPSNDLKDLIQVAGQTIEAAAEWEGNPLGEKVKLVWDQLGSKTAGDWTSNKYNQIKDANVISPTWFEFEDEAGNLSDKGTREYVLEARKKGLKVWPLLSHNFTNTSLTKIILSSTAKRQHVIDQIIEKSEQYGYEGINIDIENIQPETSDVWVQFMRELYPQLKAEGLMVSVDVYMPSDWSNHYQRGKIAQVCDYFIVMAYDQHWSGSETAGSVAELAWVEDGIIRNLEEVPKEKLVLGIPFYTRLWKETSDGLETSSYGMRSAAQIIKDWGITPILDEESGQKYAEIEQDGDTYKIWIEDSSSIAKRISLIEKYDLAGYGAWKLGLETADIWDELTLEE